MLTPHPWSNIEYFYFKVNHAPIALLVDWIERRKLDEHVLRVSIHSPYKREVLFERLESFMPGDNFLSPKKTAGHSGEVSWDLDIEPGTQQIKPDLFPAGLLRMPDTLYESAPLTKFSGWIQHGSEKVILDHVAGAVTHYWGRQLIQQWWWVSAQQFDRENFAVECSVFRTSLWGTALQMPFAFLYLCQNRIGNLWMAPPNRVYVQGNPDKFIIGLRLLSGKKIMLAGTGREYGDFGERIINTLTGDLEVFEDGQMIAYAKGTAGLERRSSQ